MRTDMANEAIVVEICKIQVVSNRRGLGKIRTIDKKVVQGKSEHSRVRGI